MVEAVELWSCGGGRQSAGIAALIAEGQLPRPHHVAMAALEWERKETYRYVNAYIRPLLKSLGIPFTYVSRKKYATKGFFGGEDLQSPLVPGFTNQSGAASKLPEWCSGEWKREVVMRWAAGAAWMERAWRQELGGHQLRRSEPHPRPSPPVVPAALPADLRPTDPRCWLSRRRGANGLANPAEKPLPPLPEPVRC